VDPGWKNIRIRDKHPRSYFWKLGTVQIKNTEIRFWFSVADPDPCFFNPCIRIRAFLNPWIRDVKIRIQSKHPGSAILQNMHRVPKKRQHPLVISTPSQSCYFFLKREVIKVQKRAEKIIKINIYYKGKA
jgi:hypothetical protein